VSARSVSTAAGAGFWPESGANFRKFATVGLLFGLMAALPLLHTPGEGPVNAETMATFGFIVLAAYGLGDLMETWHLPHITGYLLAGALCGPSVLKLLTYGVVEDLQLFNSLAVALIGLSAGAALEWGRLRKDARLLGSLIGVQFLVLLPLLGGLILLLSGPIPGLTLPFLVGKSMGVKAAAAICIALIGSAMSPAATVAILHETRARGPVADAAMGVSVLNNIVVVVLFAVGLGVALNLAPELAEGHAEGHLFQKVLLELTGACFLGGALGAGLALYVRWFNEEFLLILAALCFTVTWVAVQWDVQPALPFILAGFVVKNLFPKEEPEFIRVVNRLSMPVFVVFFFVAGAGLHLDAVVEMALFALLLFAGRMIGLYVGTTVGNRLGKGPPEIARYGWFGFGAQAGIALYMAQIVAHSLGDIGHSVETLAVAGIALNELSGPILLKVALGRAGEIPDPSDRAQAPLAEESAAVPQGPGLRLPEWAPEARPAGFEPWRGEVPTGNLAAVALTLRGGLQVLVRDLSEGPIAARRTSGHHFLRGLRREYLRHHRHCLVIARDTMHDPKALVLALRKERAELARRWEDRILDRAASGDFRAETRALKRLVEAIERLSAEVPVALELPFEPHHTSLEGEPSTWARAGARLLQLRQNLGLKTRLVEVRPITRFALDGGIPTRLVALAGLLALTERHLLLRARNLYEVHHHALDKVLAQPESAEDRLIPALEALRLEMEEEIQLASREVDRLADETVRVAESALGQAWRHWLALTADAGTPALARRSYRFSRVYEDRNRALAQIDAGLQAAQALTRGLASSHAMELELIRLEEGLILGVEARGVALARDLRGRIVAPAKRSTKALADAVTALHPVVDNPKTTASQLTALLQAALAPIDPIVEEALGIAEGFRSALKTEAELEPLVADLHAQIDDLTDRFEITEHPGGPIGRGLPTSAETKDIHFRDVVRQYMDVQVGRDLSDWTGRLQKRIEAVFGALQEIQRSIGFNTELALTELAVLPEGPLPQKTRKLLDELLLKTLERQAALLAEAVTACEAHASVIREELLSLVMGHARELQALLVGGRWTEVRIRLVRGQVARRRQQLNKHDTPLTEFRTIAGETARRWLGPELTESLRAGLGLPDAHSNQPLGPESFAPIGPRIELPAVYRRLFTDPALEAGDLLTNREHELESVRKTLLGQGPGISRAVGLVGSGGAGQSSVTNAILRGMNSDRICRHVLAAPTTMDQVAQLVALATGDRVMVIEGLHWLVSPDRDGLAPLRALLHAVVADQGRNGWLLSAKRPVWESLEPVVGLGDVFPQVLALPPLSLEDLQRALLNRQTMSGFELNFSPKVPSLLERIRSWGQEQEDRGDQQSFFRQLHRRSGGVLNEAEALWMASVHSLDQRRGLVTIGSVPPGPDAHIERLSDEDLLTLRLIARSGRVNPEQHARWLRWAETSSEAHLSRLHHWGLLARTPVGYALSASLAGPVTRCLRGRGWLP
jgi:Kef-type K+ transport system membrane component KefB